jgi:acetyl esterase/lipase
MDPREVMTRPAPLPDAVLRYGEHPEHLLDVHLPPSADAPAPVVFLVHGGFWRQRFDRRHTRPLAQALATEGFAVVTPEFRRVGPRGAGGWPATFDDLRNAFAHVPALAEVAPGRLALDEATLVGHSAGGHLAMLLGLAPDGPARPRVRRVVALAPVADLYDAFARGVGADAAAEFMGGSPEDLPEQYAAANPAGMLPGDGDGDVEVRVLHGDGDEQVPVEMSRALKGVDYTELAGMEHFGLIDPLSAAWPHLRDALRAS